MSKSRTPWIDGKRGFATTTSNAMFPPPSAESKARVRQWYQVWHSLTPAQQDAWRAMPRSEKDATYKMDAATFAVFCEQL